ncbi:MAG TPA: hypothetical protein VFF65_04040, partial [Phycisphaerales bacterium]|nr:hypothetical protein [Phycisphaerales bacterium]
MTPPPDSIAPESVKPPLFRLAAVALTLLPMLVRLQCPLDPLPYWDGDPLTQDVVVIGVTPALSFVGDVVTLIGSALLLVSSPRRGSATSVLAPLALIIAGTLACLWHLRAGPFNAKEAMTAGAWISGVCAAFALWRAASAPDGRAVRLVAFAILAGAIGLLAAKGLYQVAVEHPATVEEFKRNRDAILLRNGWSPDSSMAKAYERRLMQAEASGWFGFANVFASFAAMGVAVSAAFVAGAWRSLRES